MTKEYIGSISTTLYTSGKKYTCTVTIRKENGELSSTWYTTPVYHDEFNQDKLPKSVCFMSQNYKAGIDDALSFALAQKSLI